MVAELAVDGERIDVLPEDVEKLRVGDLGRIEDDLDGFGVAGGPGAHLRVRRDPGRRRRCNPTGPKRPRARRRRRLPCTRSSRRRRWRSRSGPPSQRREEPPRPRASSAGRRRGRERLRRRADDLERFRDPAETPRRRAGTRPSPSRGAASPRGATKRDRPRRSGPRARANGRRSRCEAYAPPFSPRPTGVVRSAFEHRGHQVEAPVSQGVGDRHVGADLHARRRRLQLELDASAGPGRGRIERGPETRCIGPHHLDVAVDDGLGRVRLALSERALVGDLARGPVPRRERIRPAAGVPEVDVKLERDDAAGALGRDRRDEAVRRRTARAALRREKLDEHDMARSRIGRPGPARHRGGTLPNRRPRAPPGRAARRPPGKRGAAEAAPSGRRPRTSEGHLERESELTRTRSAPSSCGSSGCPCTGSDAVGRAQVAGRSGRSGLDAGLAVERARRDR